ncbi:hypothetical protein EX30DRAFT_265127 [Ascodesmis nigricans]|uniref:Uncharacterized protein n=1 Tax=Ascodesmis nigricans TaxID=341454 RepID=A0A4S2MXS6_9PEZI|nr:hypothetical protein EX30DRAFT_265127 [Ascodesmis nigricans]
MISTASIILVMTMMATRFDFFFFFFFFACGFTGWRFWGICFRCLVASLVNSVRLETAQQQQQRHRQMVGDRWFNNSQPARPDAGGHLLILGRYPKYHYPTRSIPCMRRDRQSLIMDASNKQQATENEPVLIPCSHSPVHARVHGCWIYYWLR